MLRNCGRAGRQLACGTWDAAARGGEAGGGRAVRRRLGSVGKKGITCTRFLVRAPSSPSASEGSSSDAAPFFREPDSAPLVPPACPVARGGAKNIWAYAGWVQT
jgi:hypothetical protein